MAVNYVFHRTRTVSDVGEREFTELAQLQDRFREHHIFYLVTHDRGVRFVADGIAACARPHTVITDDLTELREELEKGVVN